MPVLDAQVASNPGGSFTVAMDIEPPHLNSQLEPPDGWAKKIASLVYDSLAAPSPAANGHTPLLAERWEIGNNGLSITFYLQHNAFWHDDWPFSADDVVYTFDTLLDPRNQTATYRTYLSAIASYTKVDRYTVRFDLKEPYVYAFDAIAETLIYPKHVFDTAPFNTHWANRRPVGTGPWRYHAWVPGDRIELERNPSYYLPAPSFDHLIFKHVPDANMRLQMLERGDLDVVERITPLAWQKLMDDPVMGARFWRLKHTPSSLQWIGWNEARPYFDDVRVRRALTMLIDRQAIVETLRLGIDVVAASWFYPDVPEYNKAIAPWPYNPEAAQKLLDEAGWRDLNNDGIRERNNVPFRFHFAYPAGNPFYEQLALTLQHSLARAHISLIPEKLEWSVFMRNLQDHNFDACSLLWQLFPRSDPFQQWHSSAIAAGSNFVGFRDNAVDTILEQTRHTSSDPQRIEQYHRLSVLLHDQEPYTMLFYRYNLSVVSKRIGGIVQTPYGILDYRHVFALW